jgi:hypothetical protein
MNGWIDERLLFCLVGCMFELNVIVNYERNRCMFDWNVLNKLAKFGTSIKVNFLMKHKYDCLNVMYERT